MASTLEDILVAVCRPALRLCLRNGVRVTRLLDLLKAEAAQLARLELEQAGEKQTVSRLSLMTGINRKEVKRILERDLDSRIEPLSIGARVIAHWQQSERWTTKKGKPKTLRIQGEEDEFSALVAEVNKDVGPAAILFDLERVGAVERTSRGLQLMASAFRLMTPREGYNLLARDIEALAEAAEENIERPEKVRNLHARTEYDNIYVADLPKVRLWLREEGLKLHERTRKFLAKFDKDLGGRPEEQGGGRVILGTFSLVKPPFEEL